MLERGLPKEAARTVCYDNPLAAYGQSGQIAEEDWLNPPAIDQRQVYSGNSVLRGGRDPVVEDPAERRKDSIIIE
jgi:hypothetical protein